MFLIRVNQTHPRLIQEIGRGVPIVSFSFFCRPEVQSVFDKYTVNFVRRLNKDKALEMFEKEFNLSPERAATMFDMFDQDRNQILSAWEFSLFFQSFGYK